MSVTPAEPTPTPSAPEPPAAAPAPPPAAPATPPWGEDFDAEKAWSLVQNLRSDKEKLAAREVVTPEQKAKLAEFDRLEQASKTELQKAQEAATKAAERIAAVTQRAVAAEVKALAANSFADPSDATAFLTLGKYAGEDGEIDTAAIEADLADILTKKPHLGKADGPRTPAPNPAQGAGAGGPAAVAQITRAELDRMTPDAIEQARLDGRLNTLLGIK